MPSWAEMGMNSNVYGMVGMESDVDDVAMYERSYVFRFCATKKPKQQKTVEKRKNQRVFFWNGIVVGWVKQEDGGEVGQLSMFERAQVKTSWIGSLDESAVDGDKSSSVTLSKTLWKLV